MPVSTKIVYYEQLVSNLSDYTVIQIMATRHIDKYTYSRVNLSYIINQWSEYMVKTPNIYIHSLKFKFFFAKIWLEF